jgi:hypothetical protein
MGAHALGAAAYALRAKSLANPQRPEVTDEEIRWQLTHMTPSVRAALATLPPVGENASGPLGPGLLASGELGRVVRELQAALSDARWRDAENSSVSDPDISAVEGRGVVARGCVTARGTLGEDAE